MPNWGLPSSLPSIFAHAPQGNAMLVFGGLLLAGLLAGALVARSRFVPRLTAYFALGIALGAGGLGWLSGDLLELARSLADLAVAVMVYQLGRYVDFAWLRREKWLLATVVTGSLLCFAFVWGALQQLGMDSHLSALAAVFAIGTGPAVVMVIVRDSRAEGQLTRRLAAMTVLNNLLALFAAYLLLPMVSSETRTTLFDQAGHTAYSLLGALVLAWVTLRILLLLARLLGRARGRQTLLVFAVITLVVGASQALQLPVLLTMLAFAILARNADLEYEVAELDFGPLGELLVVVLFVTLGASVPAGGLLTLAPAVAALVAMRALAVFFSVFAFARPARLTWRQAGLLGLANLPMTEAGLGLFQIVHLYPQTSAAIAPLMAASLVVMEVIGPLATQFALSRSGEAAGPSH